MQEGGGGSELSFFYSTALSTQAFMQPWPVGAVLPFPLPYPPVLLPKRSNILEKRRKEWGLSPCSVVQLSYRRGKRGGGG